MMPRVVSEVASANVSAANYVQQLAAFQSAPMDDLTSFARAALYSAHGVATYLSPPRIRLKTTETGNPRAYGRTVSEMLFPGIVLLVILMMSAGMSIEVWKEKGAGAVRRITAGDCSLSSFLAGKLAATMVLLGSAILLTFGAARLAFAIPMRSCLLALGWSASCAAVIYCGLLLVQLTLATERAATTVNAMAMVPLAMLGGSFFPIEAMPESFANFARLTPNGWMLVQLRTILSGPVATVDLVWNFAALAAAAALLFALARWRMEHRFAA